MGIKGVSAKGLWVFNWKSTTQRASANKYKNIKRSTKQNAKITIEPNNKSKWYQSSTDEMARDKQHRTSERCLSRHHSWPSEFSCVAYPEGADVYSWTGYGGSPRCVLLLVIQVGNNCEILGIDGKT